ASEAGAPIRSPLSKINETSLLFHVQVPMFLMRHVFLNVVLAVKFVPSGMVTSAMNCAQLQVAACAVIVVPGTRLNISASRSTIETNRVTDLISSSIKSIQNKDVKFRRLVPFDYTL